MSLGLERTIFFQAKERCCPGIARRNSRESAKAVNNAEDAQRKAKGAPVARLFVSTGCRFRYGILERFQPRNVEKNGAASSTMVEPIEKQIRIRLDVEAAAGRPFKLQLQRPICSRAVPQEIVIYSVTVRPYKFRCNNRLATPRKINSTACPATIFAGSTANHRLQRRQERWRYRICARRRVRVRKHSWYWWEWMTVTLSASSFSDIVKNIFFVPGRMRLLVIIASFCNVFYREETKCGRTRAKFNGKYFIRSKLF